MWSLKTIINFAGEHLPSGDSWFSGGRDCGESEEEIGIGSSSHPEDGHYWKNRESFRYSFCFDTQLGRNVLEYIDGETLKN